VVIPLAVRHDILRRRNLLYAAMTRGKRLVVLVARSRALVIAVQRVPSHDPSRHLRQSGGATGFLR
jgi:exodeoxyribonuclease V alpha subunit